MISFNHAWDIFRLGNFVWVFGLYSKLSCSKELSLFIRCQYMHPLALVINSFRISKIDLQLFSLCICVHRLSPAIMICMDDSWPSCWINFSFKFSPACMLLSEKIAARCLTISLCWTVGWSSGFLLLILYPLCLCRLQWACWYKIHLRNLVNQCGLG